MVHISLLNPEKHGTDKSGFVHNERVEMEDMQESFHGLENKEIILEADIEAPFVDMDGRIHLQRPTGVSAEKIELHPVFLNVSVQGCTDNRPVQREINAEALRSLEDAGPEFEGLRDQLEKLQNGTSSSYQHAEDMAFAATSARIPLSMGCFSAKDRTGFVMSRLMIRQMEEKIKASGVSPEEKKKLCKELEGHVLDKTSVSARIIFQNTGQRFLKVAPFDALPTKGFWDRMGYLFSAQIPGTLSAKKEKGKAKKGRGRAKQPLGGPDATSGSVGMLEGFVASTPPPPPPPRRLTPLPSLHQLLGYPESPVTEDDYDGDLELSLDRELTDPSRSSLSPPPLSTPSGRAGFPDGVVGPEPSGGSGPSGGSNSPHLEGLPGDDAEGREVWGFMGGSG